MQIGFKDEKVCVGFDVWSKIKADIQNIRTKERVFVLSMFVVTKTLLLIYQTLNHKDTFVPQGRRDMYVQL